MVDDPISFRSPNSSGLGAAEDSPHNMQVTPSLMNLNRDHSERLLMPVIHFSGNTAAFNNANRTDELPFPRTTKRSDGPGSIFSLKE